MPFIVNPNRKENVKDGETVYKPGDFFPRKISSLVASGLLIEVAEEPKKAKREAQAGESGENTGESNLRKKG